MSEVVAFTPKQFEALDNLLTGIVDRLETLEGSVGDGTLRGYVDDWLDSHPEATTTVQDKSITAEKLNVEVAYRVNDNDMTIELV